MISFSWSLYSNDTHKQLLLKAERKHKIDLCLLRLFRNVDKRRLKSNSNIKFDEAD